MKKNEFMSTIVALLLLATLSLEANAIPKPTKVSSYQAFAGTYMGRQHLADGSIKVRCWGINNVCYSITTDQGPDGCDIIMEFGNGDRLRRLSDNCNMSPVYVSDFHPITGQEVTGHLYGPTAGSGWTYWDDNLQQWISLPIQNIWVE
jgi:hypothetical protein